MGTPILVMGDSGAGKTTSLRNFAPEEISILNCTNKKIPFKTKIPVRNNCGYGEIAEALRNCTKRAYVIDDAGLLMTKENFDRALEQGYTKHTEMAKHFNDMLEFITTEVPDDVIVYMMMHTESTDAGYVKARTLGKMLSNNFGGGIEALFTIVIRAMHTQDGYKFIVGGDPMSSVKAPLGMFGDDTSIDNDLKYVDNIVREYYEMSPLTSASTTTKKNPTPTPKPKAEKEKANA